MLVHSLIDFDLENDFPLLLLRLLPLELECECVPPYEPETDALADAENPPAPAETDVVAVADTPQVYDFEQELIFELDNE